MGCLRELICTTGLLLLSASLAAATHKAPKPLPYSENDEMVRPDSTAQAWADQAEQLQPLGEAPHFTGFFMWRGRADRQYKPFHQWEVRLHPGAADRDNLRVRIDSLDVYMKPMHGRKGHVVDLGDLAAGETRDWSYKLNTSAPAAARVHLSWDGGSETYLSQEGDTIPLPASSFADQPTLLVLRPEWEYKKPRRAAAVRFWLHNIGEVAAEEVLHTIIFKDKDGNEVHRHEFVPEDGTVAGGFEGEQRLVVKNCPPFNNLSITTKKKEAANAVGGGASLHPGAFTQAAAIEVAELALTDEQVTAQVRNGTAEAVPGLVVTLQFFDAAGAELASLDLPAGDLAPGAVAPISAPKPDLAGAAGWGFAYSMGAPRQAGADQPERDGPIASMTVDPLRLDILDVVAAGGMVKVKARFTNEGSKDLSSLVCDLTLSDGAGKEASPSVTVGDLPAGGEWTGSFTAAGIAGVSGVGLQFRTGAGAAE